MVVSSADFPLGESYFSGLKNITPASKRIPGKGLPEILDFLQGDLANGNSVTHPMSLFGAWAINGDGARTNGAGLVGDDVLLVAAGNAYAKVFDASAVAALQFNPLATSSAGAGYTANYQLIPDTSAAGDIAYLGSAIAFAEIALDMATVASWVAGVAVWEYWDGAAWSALTLALDNTDTGAGSFLQDGAISFVPPDDWTATEVDSQSGFWIRFRVTTGLTTSPALNATNHEFVTPEDSWVAPCDGTVVRIRASTGAATLPAANATKFVLMNFTTGLHTAEREWAVSKRTYSFTLARPLTIVDGDQLGVIVTQEDGTNEHLNVMFELEVAAVNA